MVLDSMVDVQCCDIGVKFLSMWGQEPGKYLVAPLTAGVRPPKLYGVSSCCTELVLFVSLLPLEELFDPDRFAGGKLLVYLMTCATSRHQILLLLDQCRPSKSCGLLKLGRVLAPGRSRRS